MQEFLVRDCYDVHFIIKLEKEEYWNQAKTYLCDMRKRANNMLSDLEIIEQFFIENNIPYQIIDLPNETLYL